MTESEYIELKVNRVKRKALGTGVHYRLRNKNHAFDLIGTLHLSLSFPFFCFRLASFFSVVNRLYLHGRECGHLKVLSEQFQGNTWIRLARLCDHF